MEIHGDLIPETTGSTGIQGPIAPQESWSWNFKGSDYSMSYTDASGVKSLIRDFKVKDKLDNQLIT